MRVIVDKHWAELSAKRICEVKLWNSHIGRMNKEDAKTINAYLDTLQSKVYEAHRSLMEVNEVVTAEAIKNKLTGISERPRFLM